MPIRVYNTLSRTKEEFVPLQANRVSMFVCGLTPQDETHMGHAKTYVAFDVVARFLRHKGYHVFYLQNVTDIEDRIIEKMQKTGRKWKDIVNQYFGEYLEVMDALRCNSVDVYAFATDYIDDIIAQIQGLVKKGHAYVAEDGSVYYDTTTFSGWGKLSGQKVESLRPGAGIARVGQPVGQGPARMAHRGHGDHNPTLRTAIRSPRRGDGINVSAPRGGDRPGRSVHRDHALRQVLD